MFWKFGFHNASTIDSLLDKDDVALEAILDEDDLLQECKSQNTRLIDYFQRVDVLQKLFGYVTGQIEGEEKGRFKYPYVATEVLCSEIWSIVETCMNEQTQLMIPFWETVMDRPPEDMKTEMIMASHFAKINAVFLNKKPAEMFAFIRSQPSVVERLLLHIETPSFVDLLVRIIQLDENPTGAGVLEWLSAENLMGRLIDLLSPTQTSDIHTIVAELIKGIISMATPSPGAGLTEGLQNGPASNRFARELASRPSMEKLTTYILADFGPPIPTIQPDDDVLESEGESHNSKNQQLPTFETSTSSVVHSVSIIIELIRKNNSDYFEPYLFHTLRNRLIQVQQQLNEDNREALERAMKEMTDRMGVVHLGPVLEIMCEKLEQLQQFLRTPRSLNGPVSTTLGSIIPLTFERYRICELFAELLHCSNMSLLNRTPEQGKIYDSEGRLQGGLGGLEGLAQVISLDTGDGRDDTMDEGGDTTEPALELPVASHHDSPTLDSDDDMSDEPGSSDDDAMEEIAMYDEPQALELSPTLPDPPLPIPAPLAQPYIVVPSSPNAASLPPPAEIASQDAALSRAGSLGPSTDTDSAPRPRSRASSRKSSRRGNTLGDNPSTPSTIGEKLKQRFLDINVLSTLLDLFFAFPWNNFLHSAVYDMVHQILTGYVDTGLNRELAISLFRDARLMHRIVEGQKMNDAEIAKPKGVRLGFMGHLTLMSEDVLTALERFPPDLRLTMIQFAPDPEWDQYVTGRYKETKRRDTRVLGGGKPVVAPGVPRGVTRWKVDEDDALASPGASTGADGGDGRGELRRGGVGGGHPPRQSADFGPAPVQDEDEDEELSSAPHFARYLAQEMNSSDGFGSSESDDEDEGVGWLSQSHFSLSAPPVSARHQSVERRPLSLSVSGFEDAFAPGGVVHGGMDGDPFDPSDDDGFGPFADTAPGIGGAPASGSDPFTFSSSLSEDMEDSSSFDSSFGDFGDFQSATHAHPHIPGRDGSDGGGEGGGDGDGELTPTTGSWTFASDAGIADEVGEEPGRSEGTSTVSPFGSFFEGKGKKGKSH